MSEELPNLRIITVSVEPGKEIEVNYEGFAHWEAEAALIRAALFVHLDEEDAQEIRFIAESNFENPDSDPEDEG